MQFRQISKTPETPDSLGNQTISLLTTLCFGNTVTLEEVDLIFVFGTPYFLSKPAN